jgi:hypothetical protein
VRRANLYLISVLLGLKSGKWRDLSEKQKWPSGLRR